MVKRKNTRRRPQKKRRSFWLRLNFGLFVVIIMIVAILLLATMLGGRFGMSHQITLDFVGYLQNSISKATDKLSGVKEIYRNQWALQEENRRLQKLADKYLVEMGNFRESYREAREFEKMLNFKKQLSFQPIAARVVGKESAFWYKTIIIDRGKTDDVLEGMTVFVPEGVVGQIIHAADHYSKVLLANAPSSAIDAIIQKNRTRGILHGAGIKGYTLKYVLKNADVAVGDYVVTAGIGGIFPTGMILGTVSRIHSLERGMFQEIDVTPKVDFQKLEYVFIDPTDRKKIIDTMNQVPVQ